MCHCLGLNPRVFVSVSVVSVWLSACNTMPAVDTVQPQRAVLKQPVVRQANTHTLVKKEPPPVYVVQRASMRTPSELRYERLKKNTKLSAPIALNAAPYASRQAAQLADLTRKRQHQQKMQAQARRKRLQRHRQEVLRQQRLQQLGLQAKRQTYPAALTPTRHTVKPVQTQASHQPQKTKKPALTREYYHARYAAEQRRQQAEREKQQRERELAAERERLRRIHEARRQYEAEKARREAEARRKKARAELAARKVENVIGSAKQQIGTKYVWGGKSPATGFDCSGLVQHSMKAGANVRLPRTAAEQYQASVKIAPEQAARGDLVFFNTRGKSVSHVGIYLGGNKFLHAPRTGKTVTTTVLSAYWKKRLIGFGRIPGACRVPFV